MNVNDLNIDHGLHPSLPKGKNDFVEMVTARLIEGWAIYVPVVFPEIDNGGKPYVRNFPVLKIEESRNGYKCLLQGWGTGEISAGTPFHFISPK